MQSTTQTLARAKACDKSMSHIYKAGALVKATLANFQEMFSAARRRLYGRWEKYPPSPIKIVPGNDKINWKVKALRAHYYQLNSKISLKGRLPLSLPSL